MVRGVAGGQAWLPNLRLTLGRFLLTGLELTFPVLHAALGRTAIPDAVLSGTTTNTAQRSVAAWTIAKIVRNSVAA